MGAQSFNLDFLKLLTICNKPREVKKRASHLAFSDFQSKKFFLEYIKFLSFIAGKKYQKHLLLDKLLYVDQIW